MKGIRLGRLFGIEVDIHPSWFLVLAFFAFTLARGFFPTAYPGWSPAVTWATAIIATLLLFVSVLAHEFGHSLVARSQGIPVRNITLFALGGVSQLEREPDSPGREAWMAIAGPLVSVVIGAVTLGAAYVLPGPQPVVAVLAYLGVTNLALVVFNLLPGFPLDGGRVLRALLWRISHDVVRATRRAAVVGQVFAWGFIALGAAQLVLARGLGGIFLIFVGWLLIQAARATSRQTEMDHLLTGVTVARLMTTARELALAVHDPGLGRQGQVARLGDTLPAGGVRGPGGRVRRPDVRARPAADRERALRQRPRARRHDAGAQVAGGHPGDQGGRRPAAAARRSDGPGRGRGRGRTPARLHRRRRVRALLQRGAHATPGRLGVRARRRDAAYGSLIATTAQSSASTPPEYSLTVSSRVSASAWASSGRLARTAWCSRSSPKRTPSRRASVMPSV